MNLKASVAPQPAFGYALLAPLAHTHAYANQVSPPCEGGGQGGWSRRNQSLVRGSRAAGPRGIAGLAEHVRYALSTPPNPLFARGGNFRT